jgi:ubiquinone/menaquinone biosynthesis C-methylase UbiE
MGLYAAYIFPYFMDWVMSGEEFQRLRTSLLQTVQGEVLEIGFGTGLNLAHYPSGISHLTVIDPARFLPHKVARRIAAASFPVKSFQQTAETLPFGNSQFDWVVSTWTLCSIAAPIQALREIRRVLKPEGYFLFLEHGRSDDGRTAAWQDRLNPLQNVIGCGCNLNRQIDQLISQAGLTVITLDRFQMESVPRLGGEMYRGRATSSA